MSEGLRTSMRPRRVGSRSRHELLSDHVTQQLRQQLVDGRFAPGAKLPAFRKMADEFGVSTMTVQRAVCALEKEQHVYRMPGIGVFARSQPTAAGLATRTLVFAAAELNSVFATGIACGIERACGQIGWSVQVLNAHVDSLREIQNLDRLSDGEAAGAILLPSCSPQSVTMLFRLRSRGVPFVVLDQVPPGVEVDLVQSDHEAGAYLATRYLMDRGHRRIGMLTHRPVTSSIIGRISGYERALAERNPLRPPHMIWIDQETQTSGYHTGTKWLGGYRAALPVLRGSTLPLAIVAVDAYVAWGVYRACAELGLRIPEDVSVVAFDDVEVAHALTPPMSIIAQRTEEIGLAAVEMIVRKAGTREEAGGRRVFTRVVVDVDLIERRSVAQV